MTKNNKKAPTVPIDTFADAFCKLMKCEAQDFKIQVGSDCRNALVHYNGKVYAVNTMDGLHEELRSMFSENQVSG